MANITLTQQINAPVERVFDIATDLPRAAEHIDAIDRIEVLSDGPVGVGTRWRETRAMFGRESTEEFQITSLERPEHYSAAGESCGSAFEFTFRFSQANDGTQLTMDFSMRPLTLFAKLFSPLGYLMTGVMKKAMIQDLADIKRVAEEHA